MLAIIPARGGSKGLPGKNIKLLEGKPLIAHTIEAAKNSKHITRVIVSTDDEEIAKVAIAFGAECPFLRPAELATDTAMAVDTYIHILDRIESEEKTAIKEFVVLQPTSPLRISADIDGAINLFLDKKADSVISYTEDAKPIFWSKYLGDDLRLSNIFPETIDNRQGLKKTYHPNGAVYVFSSKLIRSKQYYTENTYAYLMDVKSSVDIDTIDDFLYAEFLLERKRRDTK